MEKTVVEVNGVKLEVDLRTAKRIETLQVGSKVKVLSKDYSSTKVTSGVVIGFEPFPSKPTILVAYVYEDYNSASIKVLALNADTKDHEIVASVDDALFDRDEILAKFDKQIATKERELEALAQQRHYFETNFAAYWTRFERV